MSHSAPTPTEQTKLLIKMNSKNEAISCSGYVSHESSGCSKRKVLGTAAVYLQAAATCIAYGIIAPFFPSEAAKKGATEMEVGLIFGVYQLVVFVASPFYGKYIRNIGVKAMFLYGSFLLGGCSITLGVLGSSPGGPVFVVMCFLSRIIEANGAAMTVTSVSTILIILFPENVGKTQGALQTVDAVAIFLGPPIGSALYSVGGYQLPFVVVGGLVWSIGFISYFMFPPMEAEERATADSSSLTQILKIPGCIIVYFSITVCFLSISFYEPTLTPFMQKEFPAMSIAQIGLLFMIDPGIYGLLSPLAGWISDKGWLGLPPVAGFIIQGLGFLLLGPSPLFGDTHLNSLVVKCLALLAAGFGASLVIGPAYPHILSLTKSDGLQDGLETLGIISGLVGSAFSLGGFLGPTLGGLLANIYGFPTATSVCGALLLIYAMVFSFYVLGMLRLGKWPIQLPEGNVDGCNDTTRQAAIVESASSYGSTSSASTIHNSERAS